MSGPCEELGQLVLLALERCPNCGKPLTRWEEVHVFASQDVHLGTECYLQTRCRCGLELILHNPEAT